MKTKLKPASLAALKQLVREGCMPGYLMNPGVRGALSRAGYADQYDNGYWYPTQAGKDLIYASRS